MQGPARILIVGKDEGDGKRLASALEKNGYECSMGDIAQSASELCGERQPDIVLLNMQSKSAREKPDTFLALAKTLKASALSSRMRVMLVGADKSLDLKGAVNDIDDLLAGPVNPAQVCHRVTSLVRLNTMHEELVRRVNTSAKYGVDAPPEIAPPVSVENATVMVLGDPTQFAMIEHSLAKQVTLVGALSEATALDYLARRSFDAVLINTTGPLDPFVPFVKEVRRQSRLFNLPVLALAESRELEKTNDLYGTGITDVMAKPYSCNELKIRVNLLVRESRFRDSLKHIYQQAKHLATSDALTGLYSRGFLLEHVASMVADASKTSQSFTLAGLAIANIKEINHELGYAAGDRIIRQVGEVIGMLIRGEDLAARYSGSKFMLALPDTPEDKARHAMQRIIGVITNTEFSVEDHMAPVFVKLDTSQTGFQKGETVESLVSRCRGMDLKAAA